MFCVINVTCRLAEGLTGCNFYKHSKIVIVLWIYKKLNHKQCSIKNSLKVYTESMSGLVHSYSYVRSHCTVCNLLTSVNIKMHEMRWLKKKKVIYRILNLRVNEAFISSQYVSRWPWQFIFSWPKAYTAFWFPPETSQIYMSKKKPRL